MKFKMSLKIHTIMVTTTGMSDVLYPQASVRYSECSTFALIFH